MRSARIISGVLFLALAVVSGRVEGAIYVIKQNGTGNYTTVMAAISGTADSTATVLQFGDAGVYNEVTDAGSSFDFGSRQVYGMGFMPTLTGTDTAWGGNEEIVTMGTNGHLEGVKVVPGLWTKDAILTSSNGGVVKNCQVVMDGMVGYNPFGIRVGASFGNTGVVEGNKITFTGSAAAGGTLVALEASGSPGTIVLRDNIIDFSGTTNGKGAIGYSTDNRTVSSLINNTILLNTTGGTSIGFDMSNANNDHNDVLQNNILVGAALGISAKDTVEAGTTTITDQNNLFYNVTTRSQLLTGAILNTSGNIDGLNPLLNSLYAPSVVNSAAVNAGLVGANYGATDFYGGPRVLLGRVDIGAVEFIPEPATLSLLGLAGLLALRRRR